MRLNLGSGQRPFGKGWTNVDTQERWKPDIVADASNLPMFADDSVDIVVLHHVLEHFGCGEGVGVLRECYRILKPGGSLLVFVPDMAALAVAFMAGRITTQIYLTNVYGAYMGDEADRHKWGFTADSLMAQLLQAARWEVTMFDWRPIEGADIARDFWIIGMECTK